MKCETCGKPMAAKLVTRSRTNPTSHAILDKVCWEHLSGMVEARMSVETIVCVTQTEE